MDEVLWRPTPEEVERASLTAFTRSVNERFGLALRAYEDLRQWSLEDRERFWESVWRFCGIQASKEWDEVLVDGDRMPGARWFVGSRLNFAENLLCRAGDRAGGDIGGRGDDSALGVAADGSSGDAGESNVGNSAGDRDALIFWGEDGARRRLSNLELYNLVSRLARSLRAAGVSPGDRVAAFMPNLPETVAAMLAAASLGAVWSSCSPDFGLAGVLDRFGQITPTVLFVADGYVYGGKRHDSIERVGAILESLPSIRTTVVVPYLTRRPDLSRIRGGVAWDEFLGPDDAGPIRFEQLPFDHPLYILYSSGTTGLPKCMVHSAGGTLLQHMKEHVLHCDFRPGERVFYHTTCGWMMWNWLVSGLASGAAVLLYDGNPLTPTSIHWDFVEQERIHHFGTSAKYIAFIEKIGLRPARMHDLGPLRSILSTGSPLSPESFDYVYRDVKRDVRLSSISGGTDILSCFLLGNPALPVIRGELQCRGLGMNVEIFDDAGRPVTGRKGELVCTAAFPSMPVGFWDDPDGAKYRAAYFRRFSGVWCHGDYVELRPSGGAVIHGRSDAVLNPGGVRIGTAEIYRVVETFPEIQESLAVAQDWKGDTRVILFVRLEEGARLDASLERRIRAALRTEESPRHVPAKIIPVAGIPRTLSGKIVELAVREVIHGRPVLNADALANPEALQCFRDLPELAED